ncbi:MAG: hypothetical protein Q8P62_05475 [Candidatus Peregrinibacteria bacterium]|nr:hypothetical protein [Candidatus Peregrinibacteria bacterium]
MKHKITEIQILPIKPRDGLVAFASFVLDGCIYLTSVGIYQKLDGSGYRLTYPTKLIGVKNINFFHPIIRGLSKAIEDAVFSKFKDVMNKNNDRYSGSNNT